MSSTWVSAGSKPSSRAEPPPARVNSSGARAPRRHPARVDEAHELLERDVGPGRSHEPDHVVAGHQRAGREVDARRAQRLAVEGEGAHRQPVHGEVHRVRSLGHPLERDLEPRTRGGDVEAFERKRALASLRVHRWPEELLGIPVLDGTEPDQPLANLRGGEEGGDSRAGRDRGLTRPARGRHPVPPSASRPLHPEYRVSMPVRRRTRRHRRRGASPRRRRAPNGAPRGLAGRAGSRRSACPPAGPRRTGTPRRPGRHPGETPPA